MTDEQLRILLLLHSFFERVSLAARDFHEQKIMALHLADRVLSLSQEYEKKLARKGEPT